MKNCIFKSLLICFVLFQCVGAFAAANKVGDVVTNIINLDDRKKVSLPEAVWDITETSEYQAKGRTWNYLLLKNRDGNSITPYLLVNYTIGGIFNNAILNDCILDAATYNYFKNSYTLSSKDSIKRCTTLENYIPSIALRSISNKGYLLSKKNLSGLFYFSSLKEDFINSFTRVQKENGDAVEINIPIITSKIGISPSDHYNNIFYLNRGKADSNTPVFDKLIDDWLYKFNLAMEASYINGAHAFISNFSEFSPLISYSIKSGEPIEVAAKTASNLLSESDKTKISQEEVYKNSTQTSLPLTLAQSEREKAKVPVTNDSADQIIVDLSFDLGDGRKIQLPNGKWRLIKEFTKKTA